MRRDSAFEPLDQQHSQRPFSRKIDPLLVGFQPGQDDFWTTDIALKYRFPKRYGFLTVGATNLFDENFNYFETDLGLDPSNQKLINNLTIQPDRMVFVTATLNF